MAIQADTRASGDGQLRHEDQTRIMLRPIGSGLPLGFFSFSVGMLVLACQSLAFIPASEQRTGGMVIMAFVFPLELVATVFAFLGRDTLGATTLGLVLLAVDLFQSRDADVERIP